MSLAGSLKSTRNFEAESLHEQQVFYTFFRSWRSAAVIETDFDWAKWRSGSKDHQVDGRPSFGAALALALLPMSRSGCGPQPEHWD
jgi:hypothetical protein